MNWAWYLLGCWVALVLERGLTPSLTGSGLVPGAGPMLLMFPAALAMSFHPRIFWAVFAAATAGFLADLGIHGNTLGLWAAAFAASALAYRLATRSNRWGPVPAFLMALLFLLILAHTTVIGLLLARGLRLPVLGSEARPALRPLIHDALYTALTTLATAVLAAWPMTRLGLPLLALGPRKFKGAEYREDE